MTLLPFELVDALGEPLRTPELSTFSNAPHGPPITIQSLQSALAALPPAPPFNKVARTPFLPARNSEGVEVHHWLDRHARVLWLSEEAFEAVRKS
jgi:hypothetical protein